jgi:aminopeptidase N
MYDDGFESSTPVYNEVDNPNEISSLFSSITYDKGASLLFMLESTVGEINFRDGLRVIISYIYLCIINWFINSIRFSLELYKFK